MSLHDRKEVVVFLTAIETSELYEIKIIALLCQTFLYNRIIFQFFSLIINLTRLYLSFGCITLNDMVNLTSIFCSLVFAYII